MHTSDGIHTLNMNCELANGETLALFGPSGRGKTTVLNMLAGLATPDRGEIHYNDRCWFNSHTGVHVKAAHRRVAFMFQDYALMPHMTVRENLLFAQRTTKDPQRVDHLLSVVQLDNLAQRYPHQLSGGQQQRIALMRCFVDSADLYLLDEPLSALDRESRLSLMHWLGKQLKTLNAMTIFVSHDLADVFFLAQKVALFEPNNVRILTPQALLPHNAMPGRFSLTGQIIAKRSLALNTHITVAVGQEVVSTLVATDAADQYQIGQYVCLQINGSSVVLG